MLTERISRIDQNKQIAFNSKSMFIYLYFYVTQQLRMEAADLLIFIGKSHFILFWVPYQFSNEVKTRN